MTSSCGFIHVICENSLDALRMRGRPESLLEDSSVFSLAGWSLFQSFASSPIICYLGVFSSRSFLFGLAVNRDEFIVHLQVITLEQAWKDSNTY
ncbi:hypothetical protein BsWGS_28819 [Bradybaena similaris]